MSFLAPLFLIGAAAIAAPIIFHLIRRTSREKVRFSSLMFLQPTPPRVTRKSRLENILLLILRCAVLALLALAFARPFLRKPLLADPAQGAVTRTVVLLDSSASMQRENLFADARNQALELVRRAGPADELAVYLFDRNARALVTFREWTTASLNERKAMAEQRLRAAEATWNTTHLGNGLLAAAEALEAERDFTAANRRVVVISDMQEGARLEGLQGFQWPRQTQVSVVPVKAKRPTNAGLQLVPQPSAAVESESVRVRVFNSPESKREQFHLQWGGSASNPVAVYVPPGQGRIVEVPKAAGANALALIGDEVEFDNKLYIVPPPREQIEVAFIGQDNETDPQQLLYYLKRAFPETAQQEVRVTPVHPGGDLGALVRRANVIVLAAPLSAAAAETLRSAVTNGATVLTALRSMTEADGVAKLLGVNLTASEAPTTRYAMLAEINFAHPLFAPFADPRFSDFTKIHFWKHRKVTPGSTNAQVLARFDTGDPAVMQFNLGKGALFLLASGWNPGDSQFALSSKFVPMLYSMLEIGGALRAQSLAFAVGDPVEISATRPTNSVTVRKPDGTEVRLEAGTKMFSETDLPGVYDVSGIEPAFRFAVNIAPEESRTGPLATEQLEQLGVPLRVQPAATPEQVARRQAQLRAAELESNQKLWRWLIVATLIVVFFETWIASRASRRAAVAAA